MNPSTALARVLVDELVRGGVQEAVLSPGSRNAPLAYALHDADAQGRLRLHVRIDERTAGFLALGLAKATGVPVPVVCTSGTAAANLHPAVLEAHHGGVPLVVVTADRPPELRRTGANQTTEQPGLYGGAVRFAADLGVPEDRTGQVPVWRTTVCRVMAAALGTLSGDRGPVHLNVPLRDPLVPGGDPAWLESLDGRPGGEPWTTVHPDLLGVETPWDGPGAAGGEARTLVVAGDSSGSLGFLAAAVAARRGWPVVAEPSSSARGPAALRTGTLLLGVPEFLDRYAPDRVLVVGRPTLSRVVGALLRRPGIAVDVVADIPRWADPGHVVRSVRSESWLTAAFRPEWTGSADWVAGEDDTAVEPVDDEWYRAWQKADHAASAALDAALDGTFTGPVVARDLVAALPDDGLLVLGSSQPIRDADLAAAPRAEVRVLANRGLAGIDGMVSTAVGAALAHQGVGGGPAYALMGDLTFLHDATGLVIGPDEPRPDLTIVVVNNDGGGIFGLLEQGGPAHAASFERVFGTPHGTDLAALCAATHTPYTRAGSAAELADALRPSAGLRVVEVRTDRRGDHDLHAGLRAAVADAVRQA
ncbi:MAG TPA: 2-succinyl-5-enolpyruvyl-6-hydroxy-3-cyclohexene-1-carboxylic-acid synthase [Mycobacteriales bacterium]